MQLNRGSVPPVACSVVGEQPFKMWTHGSMYCPLALTVWDRVFSERTGTIWPYHREYMHER